MADDTETRKPQQRGLVPFKPGQSGNPKGRPKGSRHKINEAFLQDVYEAWMALGRPALLATAWQEPATFVKVVASLMPKEIKFDATFTDMTDEQLRSKIRQLADTLGSEVGGVAVVG